MKASQMSARIIGVLFLVSYAGVAISAALLAHTIDPATDLASIHSHQTRVVLGVLFEFVNDAAVIGIAALMFPFLKRAGEGLALWYIGLRTLEAVMFMLASVSTLSLLKLSERYIEAGAPDAPYFQDLRGVALGQHYWANSMATVVFIAGGIALYVLLYRSQLLPRFIPVWGLIAVALLIPANVLAPDVTGGFQPAMLMYIPIVLNELFLAIWLIVKGFEAPAYLE
jgi:hypothetical protein